MYSANELPAVVRTLWPTLSGSSGEPEGALYPSGMETSVPTAS